MDKENTDGQPAKLYRNKETGELFTYRGNVERMARTVRGD